MAGGMKPGKNFESDWRASCPSDMFIFRIPDIKYGGKSLCDFLMFTGKYFYALELKSTQEKTFPFKNIADHQLESMRSLDKHMTNFRAGFVINFRMHNKTYFVPGPVIAKLVTKDIKRISTEELDKIGILIPQVKKRTRYVYDLSVLHPKRGKRNA